MKDGSTKPQQLSARPPDRGGVTFESVSVVFPGQADHPPVRALEQVSLVIKEREFVSLIGPSGCGKSTLLRVISDLIQPTGGKAQIDGREPREARLARQIGFVFQDAQLLPHLKVAANLTELARRQSPASSGETCSR